MIEVFEMRMLPPPALLERLGIKSRVTLYKQIEVGLLPPLVAVCAKRSRVALPEAELDAVLIARVAGKTDDEVRALVGRLVEARKVAA